MKQEKKRVIFFFETGFSDEYFNATDAEAEIALKKDALEEKIEQLKQEDFIQSGDKWYDTYVEYAKEHNIISDVYDNIDMDSFAGRARFAEIFANALPDDSLEAINTIPDGAIPDISILDSYAGSVYKLYRAGILTGGDEKGTFSPFSDITRAEVAAIASRMVDSSKRKDVTLSVPSLSGGKRYEFVINDCSWNDAFQKAKGVGGYLVRIDTRDEYEAILSKIKSLGLTGVEFRIGARRDSDGKNYYWADDSNILYGEEINFPDYWAYAEFLSGEPSYEWENNVEQYLSFYYDGEYERWVWNDIPDNVYNPGKNRYGYIIEYN